MKFKKIYIFNYPKILTVFIESLVFIMNFFIIQSQTTKKEIFMIDTNGFGNEYEFVKYLNKKKIQELHPRFRELFDYLFANEKEESTISCWRNHYKQKTDILIKVNGVMKGISIKKGSKNSVHIDSISEFTNFLYCNGIPIEIITAYRKYHFADGTTNGKGSIRISVDKYKQLHQEEIDKINKYLNTEKMLKLAVERFVLKGNNSNFVIDALLYGEPNDFLWLTKEEIHNFLVSQTSIYSTAVHFGPLTVQPKTRCLNYNGKYEHDRFCVQIKWYSLFDDIIKIKLMNNIKRKQS